MNSMTDSENNIETTEVNETTEVAGTPEVTEIPEVSTEVAETPESPEEVTAEVTPEEATPEVSTEVAETPESPEEVTAEVTPEEATPEVSTEVVETPESPEETTEATIEEAPEIPQAEDVTPEPAGEEPQTREGMNWFVLRVASNKEDYVKAALDRKVEIEAMQHLVGRIMVPTEKTKPFRIKQQFFSACARGSNINCWPNTLFNQLASKV